MTTINIALVGCGGRGTGAAKNCLNSLSASVKIVALADAFSDRLTTCRSLLQSINPSKLDVPVSRQFVGLEGFRGAIDKADAVLLATPPGFYPDHLAYAISKGKHVFMEKPVAVDSPGVRSVLHSAEAADVGRLSIAVGLQDRHNEGMIQTVARLQGGDLGRLLFAKAHYEVGPVWTPKRKTGDRELTAQLRDWYYYTWLSGDHIVEQNIHVVDNVCWAKASYPISCQGMGGRQVRTAKEYGQIFDHHSVEYEFEDGFRLFNRCRQIADTTTNIGEHFVGDRGTCNLRTYEILGSKPWKYTGVKPDPYQKEIDLWLKSVVDAKPFNEAYKGAWATLTAIMGRMASYSGRVITWQTALNSQEDLAPEIRSFSQLPPIQPDSQGNFPVILPGGGSYAEVLRSPRGQKSQSLRFQGLSGSRYQLESASKVDGPWESNGEPVLSSGNVEKLSAASEALDTGFYRFRKL